MKRLVSSLIFFFAVTFAVAACTPQEAIWWAFHDLGDQTVAKATRVAACESGLNPNAVSPGGGNWGLFQINTVHRNSGQFTTVTGRPWADVLATWPNAFYARWLYDQRGWQPWPICGKR